MNKRNSANNKSNNKKDNVIDLEKDPDSDEYKPIRKIREDNSECNAIIIEGL